MTTLRHLFPALAAAARAGVDIHVETAGPVDGPTVACLHGFASGTFTISGSQPIRLSDPTDNTASLRVGAGVRQPVKQPLHIPLAMGLLGQGGQPLPLTLDGENDDGPLERHVFRGKRG